VKRTKVPCGRANSTFHADRSGARSITDSPSMLVAAIRPYRRSYDAASQLAGRSSLKFDDIDGALDHGRRNA
jgi:hypothetical protein